jgi:hypothetical protein
MYRCIASSLTTRCPSLPPRELSFSRGDLPEALERQFHAAAPADLAGGFHWRIPRRADAPAGYDNHPMIVPVATSLPRYDIDSVDAVVILPRREAALHMRGVGNAYERRCGEKMRISWRRHVAVLPPTWYPLADLPFAKRYGECFSQNSQSVAARANKFGDPRLQQSRFRLSWLASREINARRSGAEQCPRGLAQSLH